MPAKQNGCLCGMRISRFMTLKASSAQSLVFDAQAPPDKREVIFGLLNKNGMSGLHAFAFSEQNKFTYCYEGQVSALTVELCSPPELERTSASLHVIVNSNEVCVKINKQL